MQIEGYERRRWGLRKVIEAEIRLRHASASPSQIGIAFSMVGEKDLWKRVDKHRGVEAGASVETLERITRRRNVIVHSRDRKGHGRAAITVAEVEADLACVVSIVSALDALV